MKTSFVRTLFGVVMVSGLYFETETVRGQNIVFSTNTYTTGNGFASYNAITADVFGTGRPAIITPNQSDGTLTVLGNFGNGTFVSNATYNVSSSPTCVVAADVNLDGKIDLIGVGNSKTTVLTNFNFGVFGSNATINAGGNCAVTFDLNNDGWPDLLLGGNSSLVIFTNNGSGHFGSNATLAVLGPVYSMAVADVNSDGSQDLIVADYNYASLTIFTNNGNGGLVSNATYPAGSYLKSFAVADVNGDGFVDLITPYNGQALYVLTNNGSGGFGFNATLNVPAGNGVYGMSGVVAADLNGDGWVDLVGRDGSQPTDHIVVWTNSAAGFLNYRITAVGAEDYAMSAADLNGDNKPDLVLANNNKTVSVLLNNTLFASPPLNLTTTGSQSVLYWNSPAPNSVLQATTNLLNPNWVTVPNGTPITGVILPQTTPAKYYRLKSQ